MRHGFLIITALALATSFSSANPASVSNVSVRNDSVRYCVGKQTYTVAGPRMLVVHIGLKSRHFNREDMSTLAHQLNARFPDEPRLMVWIFDSCDSAKTFTPLTHSRFYDRDYKALRGFYDLDRQLGKETIEFSSSAGKPRDEIKLNLHNGAV